MNTNDAPVFEDDETDHVYTPTEEDLAEAVADALAEIKEMNLGFCKSFSELHDHVDANEIAGFCEERFHWTIEAMNKVHDAVSEALGKDS